MVAMTFFKVAILSNFQHISLLVLASLILAANVPEDFISIDCGSPADSIDPYSGFPYKSDKNLINSGESSQISPELREYYDVQYITLRRFPEGVKNCYNLRPDGGRNNKYLIRAFFLYGNYDGRNTTPIFGMYVGVSLWDTISSDNTRIETIYMATTDYIEVCLVNIGVGIPYITILEVRRFHHNVLYPTLPHLFPVLWYRYYIGVDDIRRYPQDVEDRLWIPYEESGWESLKKIQTNASIEHNKDDDDDDIDAYKLPESVYKTAYRTQNSSTPFVYTWIPYGSTSLFYFCFHFTEIEKMDSVREMSIVLNGIHTISQSLKLYYLKPQTICSTSAGLPVNLNQQNYLHISSVASPASNLPPIFNAFEVFYLMDRSQPTFLQDVNAIMDMKKMVKGMNSKEWQGDPCLPTISLWNGLKCSTTNPPRIISLNLSRSKLMGEIPFSISNLTQLETLDLSYNNLSGPLPIFLAQLPHLKILNLVGNNLGGIPPEALLQKSRDGVLDLSMSGNPELCLSRSCTKRKSHSIVPVIVAVVAAALLLICFLLLLIYITNNKKNWMVSEEKISVNPKNQEYSYSEIVSITDNFGHIIGEGGFGKIYKGVLKNKTLVAVKVLSSTSSQGYKEFQAEVQLLMVVHHRNLVSLVGYCNEGNTKALIYEYMVNGNLHQHLSETNTSVLSWNERLQIAIDAAHGLEYLHNGCKPPIVHRDLKPANILLDDMMQAKIADFGLCRPFPTETQSHITTQLAGTPGYLDPQSQVQGNLSKKSDVYSFGIILLELITGRGAVTRSYSGNYNHIIGHVTPIINSGNIEELVDVKIKGKVEKNSIWKMAEIAMSCTQPIGNQRPDISDVLEELQQCLAMMNDQQYLHKSTMALSTLILDDSDAAPCLR